ncbi:MAG: sensor histidine kinase KdpD [Nitrococcus sp.]|nr:sensor histidine kinase KdpD [Nitrococcus sp.]
MPAQKENRPNPDALLAEMDREQRGGLKIFLGAAPGVGKTYAMLLAAREAHKEGRDVVVGVIESHGRQETEVLCEGLDRIPLQSVPYRGRTFPELDLDAVIERRPAIVLVDELAHRNIPGTRHPRRYHDIDELLEHGIEVWTTLNVQHLESLNDSVARISGARMRETVPDNLLEKARDVVLIDLTPRELIERLKQGKVYVPEQARAALDGFFNPSNLTALREMAFVAATNRVDADLREAMRRHGKGGPWPARERLVIAIDGRRNSDRVVRAGKRLADQWRAPWTVVYVDTGRARGTAERESLERAFQLTERLGGDTALLRGPYIDAEIVAYARDHNVTTIVIGRTRERPLAALFRQTLTQRLLRRNKDFEITVIGAEPDRPAPLRRRWESWRAALRRSRWHHYGFAVLVVALCVVVCAALERVLPLPVPTLSLVFLTGVLFVAARTTLPAALAAVVISSLAFNYFFTAPRFSFSIYNTGEIITVLLFLVVAVMGGNLASRLRAQVAALRATNAQSQALLALSKRLAKAPDPTAVRRVAAEAIASFERVPACLLMNGEPGTLRIAAAAPEPVTLDDKARAAADWAYEHSRPSGYHSETLANVGWRFIPLLLEKTRYGVLGVRLGELPARPGSEQLLLLDALANQVTLTLARTELTSSLSRARVAEETERLRSALLSSVSHDLRTPLSSMLGSASTLRDLGEQLSAADKRELLEAILGEGQRLNRYIENLLDMTRLGHGTLKLARDWVALADIVASALRRLREALVGLRVVRDIPDELPLLYVHPALIEQALVNVIENAASFSRAGGEVRIAGRREGDRLRITVSDQGPGIPEADRPRVFDMFFTGEGGDTGRRGSGLGLAICHGMVGAHGGSIEALPGPAGRGTTIAIRLPVLELPKAPEEDQTDGHGQ